MFGMIVGGVLTGLSILAGTAKDMHSNGLILKKELAEIEANKAKFLRIIDLYEHSVNKTYDLEIAHMNNNRESLNMAYQLLLSIDKLPENDRRVDLYFKQVTQCIDVFSQNLLSPPKFFNSNNLQFLNNIPLDNSAIPTQIGSGSSEQSQLPNLLNSNLLTSNSSIKKK